jgi:lysophospholipase L1-like esterase
MKILFYGDSITDMNRSRTVDKEAFGYGVGYVQHLAGELIYKDANKYEIIDRGVSGNRIVDLYARIKADVWNHKPDVLSILIGVNDVWHEVNYSNGVELDRFDRIYRMLIDDTLKVLPNLKIMLLEPFFLEGSATQEKMDQFSAVYDYAKVVKKIAEDYNLVFVPLQKAFNEKAKESSPVHFLYDGVHPDAGGARLIANEWLKGFSKIDK